MVDVPSLCHYVTFSESDFSRRYVFNMAIQLGTCTMQTFSKKMISDLFWFVLRVTKGVERVINYCRSSMSMELVWACKGNNSGPIQIHNGQATMVLNVMVSKQEPWRDLCICSCRPDLKNRWHSSHVYRLFLFKGCEQMQNNMVDGYILTGVEIGWN